MRFVIFDDETMEPITVINLPGVAERDIWKRLNGRIRLALPVSQAFTANTGTLPLRTDRDVELWFERFVRNGHVTSMCFTKAAELAMLLEPDFLPGQRRRVSELEDANCKLARLILSAISR